MDGYVLFTILLVTLGVGILIAEVFIPSAGLLSIVALASFAGSGFCAWKAWYETGEYAWWWCYVVGMVVVLPAAVCGGLYILPRTSYGRSIFAAPQSLEELTPFQDEEDRLRQMVNQTGTATTLFSPGGMVQIGRERIHAESEGMMIEPQTDVVVVGVKGNRLVVRPVSMYEATADASGEGPNVPKVDTDNESLDFDVPDTA
jgi:membrane-bound ClpP family serine protease